MNTKELTKQVAIWAFTKKDIETVQNGAFVYRRVSWDDKAEEWNIELIPDLTLPESANFILKEIVPILTTRFYEPSITYDHEVDQWCVKLVNWASGCSKDTPVFYCKSAVEIPQAICECIAMIKK